MSASPLLDRGELRATRCARVLYSYSVHAVQSFVTQNIAMDGLQDGLLLRRGSAVQLPIPEPTRVLHVHGRGTVGEPQPARRGGPSKGRYSSHTCIGDMSTVKPRAHRSCVFEDVCLDTRTAEGLYYRDPSRTQPPILFDRRYGHTFAFGHVAPRGGREDMLPLNKHVRYKRHVRWSPRMVDGPLPPTAPLLRSLHLLSAPFVPTNLGHLAWEEAFPLLLAMAQLGELAQETQTVVLRTHGCNESIAPRATAATTFGAGGAGAVDASRDGVVRPPTRSEARLCDKFVDGFLRPIGQVMTVRALASAHAAREQPYVCFSKLIAGGYYDLFNQAAHAGKEPWLQLYRHRVLAHHRLAPPRGWPPPPRAHKMILVKKEGRRGIANLPNVLAHVRARERVRTRLRTSPHESARSSLACSCLRCAGAAKEPARASARL